MPALASKFAAPSTGFHGEHFVVFSVSLLPGRADVDLEQLDVALWLGAGSGPCEFIAILPTVKKPKSMSGLELAV